MPPVKGTRVEDKLGDGEQVPPIKYDITSYGADFLVDGLVSRLQAGDIFIPQFQRGFVWSITQASRFIESLLLGLPVPGIFLSKDYDTEKLLVIDGQQRLKSLIYFYEGIFHESGRQFSLRGVQQPFAGLTYKSLRDEDRRRLGNSILHSTIVRQESPPEDDTSIYYIFERINTSGTPLSPQEIRACIYHGGLNDLLGELNDFEAWRSVFGPINKRMKDQELILRFLAFYFDGEGYQRPMKEFLNDYAAKNRNLQVNSREEIQFTFTNTIDVVNRFLGGNAFRPVRALNAAVFDSVTTATAHRLDKGPLTDKDGYIRAYRSLLKDQSYLTAVLTSTADEKNVQNRLLLATSAFADVE
ncbi:DUF262 domain-containing protein [Acidobacteria bacterium AH-259-D05]|nr:DUF262 domain-containing protein [Acidobacteria bacterium AH-259-D05]